MFNHPRSMDPRYPVFFLVCLKKTQGNFELNQLNWLLGLLDVYLIHWSKAMQVQMLLFYWTLLMQCLADKKRRAKSQGGFEKRHDVSKPSKGSWVVLSWWVKLYHCGPAVDILWLVNLWWNPVWRLKRRDGNHVHPIPLNVFEWCSGGRFGGYHPRGTECRTGVRDCGPQKQMADMEVA